MDTHDIINEEEIYNLSNFFKVMGDETRLKILSVLEMRDCKVCDLCAELKMTMPAISHQLRVLKQNDLVRSKRQGKNIIYGIADEHIKGIIQLATTHINEK